MASLYLALRKLSNKNDAKLIIKAFSRFFPEATEKALTSPPDLAGITATAAELNRAADVSGRIVNVTASTLAVSEATHEGKVITLDRAAGITVTLPAATGSGARYTFLTKTTVTSNNNIIQVTGDDTMKGTAWMAQDGGDTVVAFETAADSDTVTMNGSTKGGIVGSKLEFIDYAADTWNVHAFLQGTGSEATPFSAAV